MKRLSGRWSQTVMTMMDDAIYETGVLDKEVHGRLVADLSRYSRAANVPKRMIWTPLSENCSQQEIEWVRDIRLHSGDGVSGLVYVGELDPPALVRMSAIGGALLRNFIGVRMISVHRLIEEAKQTDPPETVLMVHDFHSSSVKLPKWQTGLLASALENRSVSEKQTILYADSLDAVEQDYGPELVELIRREYTVME